MKLSVFQVKKKKKEVMGGNKYPTIGDPPLRERIRHKTAT